MEDKILILCDANDWAMLLAMLEMGREQTADIIHADLMDHLFKMLDRSQNVPLDSELFEEIELRLFPEAPDNGGEPNSWKPKTE